MDAGTVTLETDPGITVVTVRSKETIQNATYELLTILCALTSVSLITTTLSPESPIFSAFDVVEISDTGTGSAPVTVASRFVRNQVSMCRAIRNTDHELVLFFGASAYVLPILYARLGGKTVILEPRGNVPLTLRLQWEERLFGSVAWILSAIVGSLEAIGYRLASAIITYTPSMADELGLTRFDEKLYTKGARHVPTDVFRTTTEIENRERRIGFVGRLDVEKGIPTLVSIAHRLPSDVGVTFVGEGPYRAVIENELTDDIQQGRVEITGWVDQEEVARHLNRLQLLVMPSAATEGLPSTILESFACGTPVLATPVSGIPDVVEEGRTGFLMRSTDPTHLAERIDSILDDPDLPEISRNCQTLIRNEYSLVATRRRYHTMLSTIVSG